MEVTFSLLFRVRIYTLIPSHIGIYMIVLRIIPMIFHYETNISNPSAVCVAGLGVLCLGKVKLGENQTRINKPLELSRPIHRNLYTVQYTCIHICSVQLLYIYISTDFYWKKVWRVNKTVYNPNA